MLRVHVGRVLAAVLLVVSVVLVGAALWSQAGGASATTALGAPAAEQLPPAPVEPEPEPGAAGFKGTVWCGGLLQTKEAEMADACTAGIVLLNMFVLVCCFLALAVICDDYLVPPIEHFCERYQIPDEAAGASFLAFGSSAPEIVIASIATLGGAADDDPDGDETGLSTVLGSAVLAFGLIPAVSAILAPPPTSRSRSPRSRSSGPPTGGKAAASDYWDPEAGGGRDGFPPELAKGGLLLEMRPLIRDVSFAVLGFGMIFAFGADGVVSRGEALVLVGGFFVYMAVVFIPAAKQAKKSKREQAAAAALMMEEAIPTRGGGGGSGGRATTMDGHAAPSPTRRASVPPVSVTDASDAELGAAPATVAAAAGQRQQVLQVSGTYVDTSASSGGNGASSGGAGSSGSYGTFEAANAFDASSGAAAAGRLSRVIEQLRRPIEWICHHTIPHEPEPGEETTRWLGCEKRHCLRHLYI